MARLIVFTRFPRPGQAKTRLIERLGERGAAALYRRLTERTVRAARQAAAITGAALEVCYTGAAETEMRAWLGESVVYSRQRAGGLGARMADALQPAIAEDAGAVLFGCDCPDLSADILAEAVSALAHDRLVLGPAADGGYYLIGMNRFARELFDDIPWGTNAVLAGTLSRARALGFPVHLLPELHDLDRPADLDRWPDLPSGAGEKPDPIIQQRPHQTDTDQ